MRIWLWGGFSVALVLALAAAQVRQGMAGPIYRPGDARAVLRADEALGADPADAQRWRVAPDVTLYHFEEGQGREALVVHGGPGFPPSQPWRAGALLSDRYRLVYYHQRGCGRSSRPISSFAGANMYENMQTLYRKLGLAEQVADIERIRRILGREKLILMGHSFGADLAALYAAEFPERVAALVFVAPANLAVMPGSGPSLFDLVRQKLPENMQPEYGAYLGEYFNFWAAFRRTEAESSAFYGRLARFYGAAANIPEAGSGDVSGAGYLPLAVYLSMGQQHDYSSAYRTVKVPVLVIHGGEDLQPEAVSRAFAAWFPASRFVRIDGAGHFVFNEQPKRFAQAVGEFLREAAR